MNIEEALTHCQLLNDVSFPIETTGTVTLSISTFRGFGIAIHYYGTLKTDELKHGITLTKEYDKVDRKHDLRYHSDRGFGKYMPKIGDETSRWRDYNALVSTAADIAKILFPNKELKIHDTTRR